MADANEDLLHTASSTQPADTPDSDDDDDTGDMAPNFLNLTLTSTPSAQPTTHTSTQPSGALPKRGMKDFEANPTLLQSRTLAASRQAMHDALSHTRVHNPHGAGAKGGTVVGTYDAGSGETFVRKAHARGKMFATVGAAKRVCLEGGIVREGFALLPEEALWALESGRLDVRYPGVEGENVGRDRADGDGSKGEEEDEDEELGMPMSLQGAYAAFIGEEVLRGGKLTIDRYLVYAALKRAGYVVTRAEGWDGKCTASHKETQNQLSKTPSASNHSSTTIWSWLCRLIFQQNDGQDSYARQRLGPLVPPGLYRNYNDIYRLLHLIPSYSSEASEPKSIDDALNTHPFTTTFYVYKPSANYRKSAPGPPDFRICVISARDTPLPTLPQLSSLMQEQPLQEPRPKSKPEQNKKKSQTKKKAAGDAKPQEINPAAPPPAASETVTEKKNQALQAPDPQFTPNTGNVGHMYSRLKRGRKNVILAVVDDGLVSYLRLSDSCFGLERLYERHGGGSGQGGKGGGGKGKNKGKGGK